MKDVTKNEKILVQRVYRLENLYRLVNKELNDIRLMIMRGELVLKDANLDRQLSKSGNK